MVSADFFPPKTHPPPFCIRGRPHIEWENPFSGEDFPTQNPLNPHAPEVLIQCPPAVDLFEGQSLVPVGANISIRDYEPLPGAVDDESQAMENPVVEGGL